MNFENDVTLTLRISNDTERRKSIKSVSDKLVSIRAYLNTGKNRDGEYNPLINFDVNIFTGHAKTPTNIVNGTTKTVLTGVSDLQAHCGDLITVKGSLSATEFESNKEKVTTLVIYAKEITVSKDKSESNSIWND